jgi:glycosyltransferase involved in cell wall biosynthesis
MEPLSHDPVAIDIAAEAGWPGDAVVLTMIGRLDARKGHRFAIEALRQIVREGERRARLFVAGTGREEQTLRDLVTQSGMNDYVHFAGFRSDVPEILARTDLFLLPSLSEGLPYTVLEAARQGVPTLGSRLEGTEDVLTDGETTFFVPPGDVRALRDSLRTLIADPVRRRTVGAAARRHLETSMGVERMFDETFRTYRRALADRGGTPSA